VRLVSASSLESRPGFFRGLRQRSGPDVHAFCLVLYTGSFRSDQVDDLAVMTPPDSVRAYAVVAISMPHRRLVATYLLVHEPLRFRHTE
jgi:hypothetical protein